MPHNLRIVPAKTGTPDAMGTEVWCGDQQIMVQSITLRADAQTRTWLVTIEALAELDGEIVAEQADGA